VDCGEVRNVKGQERIAKIGRISKLVFIGSAKATGLLS
jgi:hypothetical protein